MNRINRLAIVIAASLSLATPLAAQGAGAPVTLTGDVMAEKVVLDADGKESIKLVEPTAIIPGDRLVFGTDYANTGAEVVSNFVVTNPLPAAVRLAPDADPALVVSVDDGKTFAVLAGLSVTGADGTARPAAHADVTHVRWVLARIAPGETGRLTYPAIIR
ncbi:MAG: hypothetical protein GW858_08270 [Sphingomonadales bacterium]|nr:hypothetical protein [Sphingomonadales bacterium]NCQ21022.1 hypothetical protein [Sphingomonadales bacterium]NCT03811.1 hypothetical protein [Sphingomonadales bacterium]